MIRVDGRDDSSSLIRVRGLNKTYSRGGEKIQVLQGLNMDVDKGDFVAFMGNIGSDEIMRPALIGSRTALSTGAMRRADLSGKGDPYANIVDFIDLKRFLLLTNTSG